MRSSHPHPPDLQLNDHEFDDSLPSPAYRQYPSTSNLHHTNTNEEAVPAYIMDTDTEQPTKTLEKARKIPEKDVDRPDEGDVNKITDEEEEEHVQTATARVHYPQDLPALPSPIYLPKKTTGETDSRTSSVIGTDDEDDDGLDEDDEYDWSGEEDLVDEEAKFERQMKSDGRVKRWGPRR